MTLQIPKPKTIGFYTLLVAGLLLFVPKGIGQNLNRAHFDVLHYTFNINLNDSTDIIQGRTQIKVIKKQDDQTSNLIIELVQKSISDKFGMTVRQVSVNDQTSSYNRGQEEVIIPLPQNTQKGDTIDVEISYFGQPRDGLIIGKNKFGSRTFFGDNWPNRAHHWLPTIDHPSDKATCEFVVEAPAQYDVIANGLLVNIVPIEGNRKQTHWRERTPIPTKVMVIGVADFDSKEQETIQNVPISSWVFPENSDAGFHDYAVASKVFRFFVDKFGSFPFEKLAHVQSKTRFGGMENAGNIFYFENSVTGKGKLEELIAHETAHQWFGNSLSEKDWKHVWLSEGFATYLTHTYIEATQGTEAMRKGMKEGQKRITRFISERPDATIIPNNTVKLDDLLNPNSYEKASWFLHMLRHRLGDKLFWEVVTAFYNNYALSNADTNDFLGLVNQLSGENFDSFFNQWLLKPGIPHIAYSWKYIREKKETHIHLKQKNNFTYQLLLEIDISFNKKKHLYHEIDWNSKEQTIVIQTGEKPTSVTLDPNQRLLAEYSKE